MLLCLFSADIAPSSFLLVKGRWAVAQRQATISNQICYRCSKSDACVTSHHRGTLHSLLCSLVVHFASAMISSQQSHHLLGSQQSVDPSQPKKIKIQSDTLRDRILDYPRSYTLSFAQYWIIWMHLQPKQKYHDLSLTVHELLMPLTHSELMREGRDSIRRFVFVEEDGIMSFASVIDEFVDARTSILILDESGFGTRLTKSFIRSYSEYLVLMHGDWNLSIHEPIRLFKDAVEFSDTSKDLFIEYLESSGFEILNCEWQLNCPPLSRFGTQNTLFLEKYQSLIAETEDTVNAFVETFLKHTDFHLQLNTDEIIPFHGNSHIASHLSVDETYFGQHEDYDYSSEETAKESTERLIKFLESFEHAHQAHTMDQMTITQRAFYTDIVKWVRFVQEMQISQE
ncbi:hypothetical protein EDD86DRAFT_217871 [Gorgonomyces haynaldii]|nr:hypothetical protein EDD86DRAFT_217871 [Gorgonomyces haynaldii]